MTRRAAEPWANEALDCLEALPCGYRSNAAAAAEPTALAMLALADAGRFEAAARGAHWLASQQRSDGSIVPLAGLNWPGWPTPLAILAIEALRQADTASEKAIAINLERAKQWLLLSAGKPLQQTVEFGHDLRLVGWSWAEGTHSWIEPTAWSVLALKAVGLSQHPRTREGVKLLIDRLLSTGGCNYGNTVVLGQRLRPHVEPTGLTMLALAGERTDDPRVERSLRFLESSLSADTTPISLAYGILGLAAFDRKPADAEDWIATKCREVLKRDRSPLDLALLMLALQGGLPTNNPK